MFVATGWILLVAFLTVIGFVIFYEFKNPFRQSVVCVEDEAKETLRQAKANLDSLSALAREMQQTIDGAEADANVYTARATACITSKNDAEAKKWLVKVQEIEQKLAPKKKLLATTLEGIENQRAAILEGEAKLRDNKTESQIASGLSQTYEASDKLSTLLDKQTDQTADLKDRLLEAKARSSLNGKGEFETQVDMDDIEARLNKLKGEA